MAGKSPYDSVVRIPASLTGSFFKFWFEFLTPIHKLTEREIGVIACFLKYRYELSLVISDEDILDSVVMSDSTRKKVRADCNMSLAHFQVILSKLRKNKIIVNDRINKRFIPQLSKDSKDYKLLLYFDLNA